MGWNLEIPEICRNIKRGIPAYDDELDTFIITGIGEVIRANTTDPTLYIPIVENSFSRILHLQKDGNDYWEMHDKSGFIYRYGVRYLDDVHSNIVLKAFINESVYYVETALISECGL